MRHPKYAIILGAACLLLSVGWAATLRAQPDRLRVLSLNAEWFPGRSPQPAPAQQARHIASLHRLLHDLDPDLWLVQEVNCTHALDRVLAVLPDMTLYTASAFTDGPHQLAIAGRLPAVSAWTASWTAAGHETAPPRGIAGCVVEFSDGSVLPVFTLHLKSNFRGGEDYDAALNIRMRETAARQFVDHARKIASDWADRPLRGVLLGGDLNLLHPAVLFRGEQTASILETGGFTFLGADGLDHFWGIGLSNAAFHVFSEYHVSDHRPIILDIPLPEGVTIRRFPPEAPEAVAALAGNVRTDVNTAPLQELMALPGIGPVLASRILLQRPFVSVEELVEVCGIGPVTLTQMLPYIAVPPGGD